MSTAKLMNSSLQHGDIAGGGSWSLP